MSDVTDRVREYWNAQSCGTDRTEAEKHSLPYFEEIEEFRYRHEPFIHAFAQFTRFCGQKILEVGVGAGSDFLQWVRAGAQAHGVDLTQEGVENVTKRLALYQLEATELQVCNAENLPYSDGYFDLAYSWGVIHHADDMEKVFGEIYRVVRPGGTVKIMVYNLNSLHTWYLFLRYALPRGRLINGRRWAVYNYQESFATKVYTAKGIRRMLVDYPHQDLEFHYWDQKIRAGAKFGWIRRWIQRLMPRSMRWYMAFEFKKPFAE